MIIMTEERLGYLLMKKIQQNQVENKCSYWKAVENICEEVITLKGITIKAPIIQDENNPQKGYFIDDVGEGTYVANCQYHQNIWIQI